MNFSADNIRLGTITYLLNGCHDNMLNRLFKGHDILYVFYKKIVVTHNTDILMAWVTWQLFFFYKDPEVIL